MDRAALDAGPTASGGGPRAAASIRAQQEGRLPGGLNVKRGRGRVLDKLEESGVQPTEPLLANDWLSVYAMAVTRRMPPAGRDRHRTDQRSGRRRAGDDPLLPAYPSGRRPGRHPRYQLKAAAIGGYHQAQCLDLRCGSRLPCERRPSAMARQASRPSWAVRPSRSRTPPKSAGASTRHDCDPVRASCRYRA